MTNKNTEALEALDSLVKYAKSTDDNIPYHHTEKIDIHANNLRKALTAKEVDVEQNVYDCGCVTCICEDEEQCHGCGAKSCKDTDNCQVKSIKYLSEQGYLSQPDEVKVIHMCVNCSNQKGMKELKDSGHISCRTRS